MRNGSTAGLIATASVVCVMFGAEAAGAAKNVCIARSGAILVQEGTADCRARGRGSFAKATGPGAVAIASRGVDNKAVASGYRSSAYARVGDKNTAVGRDGGIAQAGDGKNNTATARGEGSYAAAAFGNRNVAVARNGSYAQAFGAFGASRGNANTAIATGDHSDAEAGFGYRDTAIARGDRSIAQAFYTDDATAIATTDGCAAHVITGGETDFC
jgi:hypothetical protein